MAPLLLTAFFFLLLSCCPSTCLCLVHRFPFSFFPFLPYVLFLFFPLLVSFLPSFWYTRLPVLSLFAHFDSLGNTPLHIAAGRKLKEIVALLMAYGANPAIANGEGDFPSDLPASLLVGAPLISL